MMTLEPPRGHPPEVAGLRLRVPLPAGVVAYRVPGELCALVSFTLENIAPLWFATSIQDCRRILREHVGLAVLATIPAAGEMELERLSLLREEFPHAGWVGLFVDGLSDLGVLARLGALGVQEIVPAKRLRTPGVLGSALSRGETASVVARLWRLTRLDVADEVSTILWAALRIAHEPISMAALATAARMHERTIRKHCERHRLASPQWIVGWARCLLIAFYLEEAGRTVQSISLVLGFATPVLLANHLRRYTGRSATELRKVGALNTVARLLEAQLRPGRDRTELADDESRVERLGDRPYLRII